jgi:hypothetical protein
MKGFDPELLALKSPVATYEDLLSIKVFEFINSE